MTSSLNRRTLRRSCGRLSISIRNPHIISPTPVSAKSRIARATVSGLPKITSSALRAIAPLGFFDEIGVGLRPGLLVGLGHVHGFANARPFRGEPDQLAVVTSGGRKQT